MSKDRDIDDILDSLNQLLREGESYNDDHVEKDISPEELEEKLHELDEEIDQLESEPPLPDEPVETTVETSPADEATLESDSEPEPESDSESIREKNEDDVPAEPGAALEEDEEPAGSPISIQRVVLTEEMLINNPQGSLLTMSSGRDSSSVETGRVDVEPPTEGDAAPEEQAGEVSHTLLHIDHHHLEQLLEQVADDVIQQLQHELPILVRRSLHHYLAEMRDAGQVETDREEHSEEWRR